LATPGKETAQTTAGTRNRVSLPPGRLKRRTDGIKMGKAGPQAYSGGGKLKNFMITKRDTPVSAKKAPEKKKGRFRGQNRRGEEMHPLESRFSKGGV